MSSNIITLPTVYNGATIILNRSKSIIIRYLIVYFLYHKTLLPIQEDDSADIHIVHHCLSIIQKFTQNTKHPTIINVHDCGTAYRFLMAILAISEGVWHLTGSERLLQRPIEPLVQALKSIGADITKIDNGWCIHGKILRANEITIHCEESSQFASSLMLISKKIGLQNIHLVPTQIPSQPYFQLSQFVMNAPYQPTPLLNESDWSSAAFWYVYLAISKNITTFTFSHLHLDSPQADRIIAHWMQPFGITSEQQGDDVIITKTTVKHILPQKWDLYNHPDLAPILSVLSVLYPCNATLSNIQNLDLKESQRATKLATDLSSFAFIKHFNKYLQIRVNQNYYNLSSPIYLDIANDHRLAMAYILLNLKYPIILKDIDCVKKSYPQFLKYFHIGHDSFQNKT